jgi:hypothetical protein
MDIQTEKLHLIEELARIQDFNIIEQVKRVLDQSANPVVGFDVKGEPITRGQLVKRIEEAEARISRGEFITQEDLEAEASNW